jgi:hypothetical protein
MWCLEGKGDSYYYQKTKEEYLNKRQPSWCKIYGETRHQAIGCHYHPSILDDKGVPNLKNHIDDFGKNMDMIYIRLTKKKERRLVEVCILENQMKQPKKKYYKR